MLALHRYVLLDRDASRIDVQEATSPGSLPGWVHVRPAALAMILGALHSCRGSGPAARCTWRSAEPSSGSGRSPSWSPASRANTHAPTATMTRTPYSSPTVALACRRHIAFGPRPGLVRHRECDDPAVRDHRSSRSPPMVTPLLHAGRSCPSLAEPVRAATWRPPSQAPHPLGQWLRPDINLASAERSSVVRNGTVVGQLPGDGVELGGLAQRDRPSCAFPTAAVGNPQSTPAPPTRARPGRPAQHGFGSTRTV